MFPEGLAYGDPFNNLYSSHVVTLIILVALITLLWASTLTLAHGRQGCGFRVLAFEILRAQG